MIARRIVWLPVWPSTVALALAVVLVAAFGLRLYGLDWDEGRDLHPDELFIAKIVLVDRIRFDWPPDLGRLLDPATSRLNPRSVDPATGEFREFAYGALPLLVTDAVAGLLSRLSGTDWNAGDRVYLVGRVLSAALDTATVGLVFLLGRRLRGPATGLFAALLAALAPMSIQLAHFFTTDSWLTALVALCLVLSIRAADLATPWAAAIAGGATGLAMATKGSAFALAAIVALAVILPSWNWSGIGRSFPLVRPTAVVVRLLAAGSGALAAFALFEPYALARPDVYLRSLRTQADIVAGVFDVPFTRVFANASPFHAVEQLFRWGYGPPAALLSALGLVILARTAASGSRAAGLMIAWVVVYGFVVVRSEVQFLRYLAPLTPVLAVAGGLALDRGRRWVAARGHPVAAPVATAVAVAAVAVWTTAFVGVYAGEHPRLAASRWMYAALPPGSTLTAEYWDDALPRDFGQALGALPFGFDTLTVDLYADRRPEEVADALYDVLGRADGLVISSNRVESAVRANPWRYPVQARFYDLLAGGRLGVRLAGEWQRPPHLGPFVFDDRDADESFINYDHPRVRVYIPTEPIDRADYDGLMAWAIDRPWQPTRYPVGQSLLLDRPVGELPTVADARWSAPVTGTTAGAVAAWLLLLVALQAVGLPLARLILDRFVDAGWGFARLLGLLAAGYLVWIGSSLQLFAFRAVWCAAALGVVGLLGWWTLRRSTAMPFRWRPPSAAAISAEVVFWLVFAVFLGLRFLNPDGWHPIWGGEKPMEFAHLNATLRSAHFPPYDPWFADGYLNYYYYGIYLVAFLLKLTGIPSEIGFNLAQPTIMALLASGVFSLAATIGRGLARRGAAIAGLVAVLLTVFVGNLTTARRLFDSIAESTPPRFASFDDWTWAGSRAIEGTITEFPFFTGLYADLHAHVVALPITVLAIALAYALAIEPIRFSAVRHRSTALRLGGLALVLGTLSATNAWDVPVYAVLAISAVWMSSRGEPRWAARIATFAAVAFGLGVLAYALFLPFHARFIALFGSLAPVEDPTDLSEWSLHVGGLAAICASALVMLLLPRRLPRPFAWVRPEVLLAGVGLAAFLPWLASAVLGRGSAVAGDAVAAVAVAFVVAVGWLGVRSGDPLDRVPVVAGGVLAIAAILVDRPVLGLAVAGLAAAGSGWLFARSTPVRFWCLLLAAAMGIVAGVELVVVADDLIGSPAYRMNTVFKFYNQVWILLAIAAGTGIAAMVTSVFGRRTDRPSARLGFVAGGAAHDAASQVSDHDRVALNADETAPPAGRRGWAPFGLAVSALVVAASLLYPLFAVGPRVAQRFADRPPVGTLDALAWMASGEVATVGGPLATIGFAGDRVAIDWFNREVPGSPVVAEASIGPYRCNGSRISIGTGLPTIIGWERHESQQRPANQLPGRVADVDRLYRSTDPSEKERILRRYNVEYVVVGDLERAYPVPDNECSATGSAGGIAAFDEMVGDSLEIAFVDGGTTVYRVLPVDSE